MKDDLKGFPSHETRVNNPDSGMLRSANLGFIAVTIIVAFTALIVWLQSGMPLP